MQFFKTSILSLSLIVSSAFICGFFSSALAQTVQVDNNPPYEVSLQNVTVYDGKISGQIVNKSLNPVQDVQLLIRRTWLWKNEFHPGSITQDPGIAEYITIKGQIRHGESMPFSYTASRSSRSDGRFMTEVSLAGFTEVIYPKR